jgi:uncharacterized protein YggE
MKKLHLAMAGMMALSFFTPSLLPAVGEPVGTISVTGDATVKVVPDEIVITLGVETQDADLNQAKEENDKRVRRVHPEYEYRSYAVDKIVGYRVGKTIVITLQDIDKFDSLLSDVLELGANYVHGVEFRTTDLRKYRDQARGRSP